MYAVLSCFRKRRWVSSSLSILVVEANGFWKLCKEHTSLQESESSYLSTLPFVIFKCSERLENFSLVDNGWGFFGTIRSGDICQSAMPLEQRS
jgi:hypothetical protein